MGARFRASYDRPPPAAFLKSAADDTALTVKSLLTYPMRDLAGDYVEPEGCDFALHRLDPIIDLEHGRDPHVKGLPVAWARDSLDEPGGTYRVEMTRLNFADPDQPADFHTVPVGTEFYKKSWRVSAQIYAMRTGGALPASSLEFQAVPGFYKALGRSPLEDRDAYHFHKARVLRWTVCGQGVNPGALLVTKSPGQVPAPLSKILTDRRVNVGGTYEVLCPVILKALTPYLSPPDRSTVRVEKSMDNDAGADLDTANDAALAEPVAAAEEAEGEPTATPTAQAAYDLAQGARDLCDQISAAAAKGEHKPGRKKIQALCEKLDSISELAMSVGKQVDADLSDDEPDGEGDEGAEKPEPEATDDDMEPDDDGDGVLKGIPPVYRKSIKRFKLADLAPAAEPAPVQKAAEPTDDAKVAALEGLVDRLTKKLSFL